MWLMRFTFSVLLLASLCSPDRVVADDGRNSAITMLVNLRQEGALARFADEYRSIEEAYAQAERYLRDNDQNKAKVYFSLVVMKARLLEERLPAGSSPQQPVVGAEAPGNENPAGTLASRAEGNRPAPAVSVGEDRAVHDPPEPEYGFVGGGGEYVVRRREPLRLVAAKLGVNWRRLAADNGVDPKKALTPGMKLKVNNRRIIPKKVSEGIVINIPDRTMYLFREGRLVRALPVAVGKPKAKTDKDGFVWHTPTGRFRIVEKTKDPVWRVPLSIQREMELTGKKVVSEVPAGAGNPLGRYAIRTSIPGIMIHSTNSPSSVYSFSSHGCIRVFPEHMDELFRDIRINMTGEIIYRPVKVGVSQAGRVLLEVNHDVYAKIGNLFRETKALIEMHKLSDRVDWRKVELVVRRKSGVAEDVTL